jgi:hypothetical protein
MSFKKKENKSHPIFCTFGDDHRLTPRAKKAHLSFVINNEFADAFQAKFKLFVRHALVIFEVLPILKCQQLYKSSDSSNLTVTLTACVIYMAVFECRKQVRSNMAIGGLCCHFLTRAFAIQNKNFFFGVPKSSHFPT